MKQIRKSGWYVVVLLVLGLALLVISCGGAPAGEQPPMEQEQPTIEEPSTPETEVVEESGGIPPISHTLDGRDDCLQCHGEGAFMPFPANHSGYANDTCQGCHQPAS
ncbi:hypothetical protein ACFLVJ_00830 [Chloroflexota bacterium]